MTADDARTTQLDALQAILVTAHGLATELTADPLLERLLHVFAKLPEPDREPILKILEREATWCRIAEQTASETGITVRPNPHASLYVHVLDQADEPRSEPLRRDIDVIRFGIEHFVRLLPLFFQEGVHAQWSASARELARDIDDELRRCVDRLAREVLELVAQPEGQSVRAAR
jgi:hypothetical protein